MSDLKFLKTKIGFASHAVDKVVHNLFMARATGWLRFRILKLAFANSLVAKNSAEKFRSTPKFVLLFRCR
jgi:hypothetical protein